MTKSQIDPQALNELRTAFNQFDTNRNGSIDRDEFRELIDLLDEGMSDEELEVGMSIITKPHGRSVGVRRLRTDR
jgi:Ca2+-binding EF-hand superfamily protein